MSCFVIPIAICKNFVAFDVRRTQHIILGFLWYSYGIPVVLKGDLLWYSFRRTSVFSAPSCIIYLVGKKRLNTKILTWQWLRGAMDNALPLHVEGLGFDSYRGRLSSFFRSRFVLFCFFFKKTKADAIFNNYVLVCNNKHSSHLRGLFPEWFLIVKATAVQG